MRTLAAILQRHFTDRPEQVCMVMQEMGKPDRMVCYAELGAASTAFARQLERAGIQPGDVVVLIYQHGFELISAFWGTVLFGAVPSIMPFLTEKLIAERYRSDLAALIAITRPAGIATYTAFEGEVLGVLAGLGASSSVRAVIVAESSAETQVEAQFGGAAWQRGEDDLVLLQHSSGTTGLQKGVALSHGAVLRQLEAYSAALGLSDGDVIVSWLPLYHDMGLIAGFLLPILMGVKLVIMSPFDWVRAPYRLFSAISQYRGTLVWMPNFGYHFCAQKIRDRYLEGIDLSCLRAVINCSEPVRAESHEIFLARFKLYGLRREVLASSYAMAENVFAVTQAGIAEPLRVDVIDRELFQQAGRAVPSVEGEGTLKMVSAGRPIRGTQVKVVNGDGLALGDREVGELAVHSDYMLSGYYNRPDETRKAFLDDWYLSGDYGYISDGEVYVCGRKKDMMIIGGKNIYPQDIEALVLEVAGVHPGRAVAFGVFEASTGTEEAVVVAEVDTEDGDDQDRIAAEIQSRVTRGTAIALRTVYLVGAKWLIKTSSGKIARSANRDKYIAETGG